MVADSAGVWGPIYLDDSQSPYRVTLYSSVATGSVLLRGPVDPCNPFISTLTQAAVGAALYPRTATEVAVGVTPTSYVYPPIDVRRYGALLNNSADDTAALNRAISVAAQSVNGALGNVVTAPVTGISLLSSMVNLPNRVRIVGANKRGTYFKATGGFSGSFLFNAANGTSSMFDSTLDNVSVDANNLASVGCILSDAWQDGNSGLRNVMLINFATYGIKFQNGYGGADFCKISDCEIFGGSTAGSYGIDVEKMSASGAVFMLDIQDSAITGGSVNLARGINMVAENLHCRNVHFETSNVAIYLAGGGNHVLIGVTGSTTVTTLVQIDPNFTGSLTMIGCYRNGGTNLLIDGRVKQIAQFGTVTGGSGYVNGTYNNVPLTGGAGTNATAQIVVSGGAVTSVLISNPGTNYNVADALSANNANLGGSGSGFSVPVFETFTGVGTISGKDYPMLQLIPATSSFGQCYNRSPGMITAWGVFDGTVTGTNAPSAGMNVLNVNRTGTGRYTVTLANAAAATGKIIPFATCASPLLTVSAAQAGGASFTIAIDTATTGAATDQNEVKFMVAGL